MHERLCHVVPAAFHVPCLLATMVIAAVGCSHDGPSQPGAPPIVADHVADPVPSPPRDLVLEQTLPPRDPPPSVCALGCPAPFRLDLDSRTPWPPGTYFIRAQLDGGVAQVCSVVFEAVFGAAHDNCREAGLPFSVAYRYDTDVRRIDSVEFFSVQHDVHVELLTAEGAPRLVDVRHELVWQPPVGCAACTSAAPLTVSVLETWASPSDAGTAADAPAADAAAGDAAASDAATGAADAGQSALAARGAVRPRSPGR